MEAVTASFERHRVSATNPDCVRLGAVRYAPVKSLWFLCMVIGTLVGGSLTFTWSAFGVFLVATAVVLLFGHSLGSHRKLVHDSYQCPKWLEYSLVYFGVQVGLAGPLGLLRQHELRDYAQRVPGCHDYLRHGRSMWVDAWWQLNCGRCSCARPRSGSRTGFSGIASTSFWSVPGWRSNCRRPCSSTPSAGGVSSGGVSVGGSPQRCSDTG